jgi:hypothetical protein
MSKQHEPITCTGCIKGVKMCIDRPCWGTPQEIKAIIDAGYGDKLMQDYWSGELNGFDSPLVIGPAIVGHEGGNAPFWPTGRCALLTEDRLCSLHDAGLKPSEGAVACCKRGDDGMHQRMAEAWATEEGQALAQEWLLGAKST